MRLKFIIVICFALVAMVVSCQSDEIIEFNRYYVNGSTVYQVHCQNCHGAKGEGLQELIPSLTDSAYLKNNREVLACFIKKGLKGNITINNKTMRAKCRRMISPL